MSKTVLFTEEEISILADIAETLVGLNSVLFSVADSTSVSAEMTLQVRCYGAVVETLERKIGVLLERCEAPGSLDSNNKSNTASEDAS